MKALVVMPLVVAACQTGQMVRIDGSSSLYPRTEKVALAFAKLQPQVQIAIAVSGSAGGLKKLCRGEIDVAETSRRAVATEACGATEVSLGTDDIVLIANPALDFIDSLSSDELVHLWRQDDPARDWNSVRVGWPEAPLRLYGASPQSATFDTFMSRVLRGSPREDYFASEDDFTVAYGIANDPHGVGFVGSDYVRPDVRVIATSVDLSRHLYLYVSPKAPQHVAAFVQYYRERFP